MYVVQPINTDRFKSFCDQLSDFTSEMAKARNATEKAMKTLEAQQQEGEALFAERVSDDKAKFAVQREHLERDLAKLTDSVDKLMAQKQEWVGKETETHLELMKQLDDERLDDENVQFGRRFGAFIDSMNNLSYQSLNDQFVVLKDNLDSLNIEKNQREVSIADKSATICTMSSALNPTCGVTYKERNVLRFALRNEISKVRALYQESRLLEESLKAKLYS